MAQQLVVFSERENENVFLEEDVIEKNKNTGMFSYKGYVCASDTIIAQ